ncbi:MAG TPA: DUF4129 domain-containing protein, partial [Acidobacteriaceae bacterium]|nr:DUF4129 domain-containing protein [Acidobacteriaceae bacterium]
MHLRWVETRAMGHCLPQRLLVLWWALAFALPLSAPAEATRVVSGTAFAAQLTAAQETIASCERNAAACDGGSLPDREEVQGLPGGTFTVGWQWLRDALAAAKTASGKDRTEAMDASRTHLVSLAAAAGLGQSVPAGEFAAARSAANAALARDEFRAAVGPSWTERQLSRIQDWFFKLFTGMDRLGRHAPWLAPLIEWGCFGLAVAGLLWYVRQSLARQALRIALLEGAPLTGQGDLDAADWGRLAEERAAAGDWREAIHCLYWAAIALLESRRAWRPNATRTPREYLRLLRPGSEAHAALRSLTRSFERAWYGHAEADQSDYRAALGSYRSLE